MQQHRAPRCAVDLAMRIGQPATRRARMAEHSDRAAVSAIGEHGFARVLRVANRIARTMLNGDYHSRASLHERGICLASVKCMMDNHRHHLWMSGFLCAAAVAGTAPNEAAAD